MIPSAEASAGSARWARYRRAIEGQPLPVALVDLDALDENIDRVLGPVRQRGKKLRPASKSIRCPAILGRVFERGAGTVRGVMTYAARETAFLAADGYGDSLLAYPTVHPADLALLAEVNRRGATAAVVVDCVEHLEAAERAGRQAGAAIPVVVEVDLSYRPLGGLAHLGVRRSPLHSVAGVVALSRRARGLDHVRLHGIMGYEAQIAGLTDENPFSVWMNFPRRAIKRLSRPRVERLRAEISLALAAEGIEIAVFNGGGTGSLRWCTRETPLTEVTAGSGFLASHLFDYYRDLALVPALYFALQVVRRPATGIVTCHGGGYVASGEAGADRLPLPALPEGLKLLPLEGAGEVQTPLVVPAGIELRVGDPVFFRPAKAGELAEHFNEYLLVRGERVVGKAPTYRGLGHSFLG